MAKMMKNTTAMNSAVNAPAGYGGNAPTSNTPTETPVVLKAVDSNSDVASTASEIASKAVSTLHLSAALVGIGLVLLWVFGGLVFKNANL